jgi:predicted TIM-barrel enzyme
MNTQLIVQRLQKVCAAGLPVILAGVGSGLTARGAVKGGADVLAVYNTAIYRIRGLSTALAFLPYDNANELTLMVAPEILANAGDVPVLVGFGAHDPRINLNKLMDQAQALGAAGVTNEPFIGMYGEELRVHLEASGLGFSRELSLLKGAVNRDMLALGWVFSPAEAEKMTDAGVQIIGVVLGITTGGLANGACMDEAVEKFKPIMDAAKSVRQDVIVLGHGGPLNDPAAVAYFINATGADGYATGSTGESIPVEIGVADTIQRYKNISKCVNNKSGGKNV